MFTHTILLQCEVVYTVGGSSYQQGCDWLSYWWLLSSSHRGIWATSFGSTRYQLANAGVIPRAELVYPVNGLWLPYTAPVVFRQYKVGLSIRWYHCVVSANTLSPAPPLGTCGRITCRHALRVEWNSTVKQPHRRNFFEIDSVPIDDFTFLLLYS